MLRAGSPRNLGSIPKFRKKFGQAEATYHLPKHVQREIFLLG